MDFPTSGWSTPRRLPPGIDAAHHDLASDIWAKKAEKLLLSSNDRSRSDVRRLELKVAKTAAKKCSVEEVAALHKELSDWLASDGKQDDQVRIESLGIPSERLR